MPNIRIPPVAHTHSPTLVRPLGTAQSDAHRQNETNAIGLPPDRIGQHHHPESARRALDTIATDDSFRFCSNAELGTRLVSELIGNPHVTQAVDFSPEDNYATDLQDFTEMLDMFYEHSPQFRALFNYKTGPHDDNKCDTAIDVHQWLEQARSEASVSRTLNGRSGTAYAEAVLRSVTGHLLGPRYRIAIDEYVKLMRSELGYSEQPRSTGPEALDAPLDYTMATLSTEERDVHAAAALRTTAPPVVPADRSYTNDEWDVAQGMLLLSLESASEKDARLQAAEGLLQLAESGQPVALAIDGALSSGSEHARDTRDRKRHLSTTALTEADVTPAKQLTATDARGRTPWALRFAPPIATEPSSLPPMSARTLLTGGSMQINPDFRELLPVLGSLPAGPSQRALTGGQMWVDTSKLTDAAMLPEDTPMSLETTQPVDRTFLDPRIRLLDELRVAITPFRGAPNLQDEAAIERLAACVKNPLLWGGLMDGLNKPAEFPIPGDTAKHCLETLLHLVNIDQILPAAALEIVTEVRGAQYNGSLTAGLASRVAHHTDEMLLVARLLQTIAAKIDELLGSTTGFSTVRRMVARSPGERLRDELTAKSRSVNAYEWLRKQEATANSVLNSLFIAGLVPTKSEYEAEGMTKSLFQRRSPHSLLMQACTKGHRSGAELSIPVPRDFEAIVEELASDLTEERLATIDNQLETRRVAKQDRAVTRNVEREFEEQYRRMFSEAWSKNMQSAKHTLEFASAGAQFLDPTGIYRDAFHEASRDVHLTPPKNEVDTFVREELNKAETQREIKQIAREIIEQGKTDESVAGRVSGLGARQANAHDSATHAAARHAANVATRASSSAAALHQAQRDIETTQRTKVQDRVHKMQAQIKARVEQNFSSSQPSTSGIVTPGVTHLASPSSSRTASFEQRGADRLKGVQTASSSAGKTLDQRLYDLRARQIVERKNAEAAAQHAHRQEQERLQLDALKRLPDVASHEPSRSTSSSVTAGSAKGQKVYSRQ